MGGNFNVWAFMIGNRCAYAEFSILSAIQNFRSRVEKARPFDLACCNGDFFDPGSVVEVVNLKTGGILVGDIEVGIPLQAEIRLTFRGRISIKTLFRKFVPVCRKSGQGGEVLYC